MGGRRRNYDVVIAGCGLVGASLACALHGHGLRIAILEAHPVKGPPGDADRGDGSGNAESPSPPGYDERKIALALSSMKIFEGIDVWPLLRDQVTPIEHVHVSDLGRFGTVRIHAADYQVAALGYCIEARLIGQALLHKLSACDDIDLLAPATFKGVEADEDGARVAITVGGTDRHLKARLLVAADGSDSMVRVAAGIEADEYDYGQVAVVANVTPERPHGHWAYERLTRTGPMALLPLSGQRCGLVWTVEAGQEKQLLALSDEGFSAALQERFGYRLGRFLKVGKRSHYPLRLVRAFSNLAPRTVLVGNAAHTIHPISAQGFNLGLRDAAALAEHVVDCRRGNEDPGAGEGLERYQAGRDADQRRTIRYTDSLVRQFRRTALPLVVVRNAAMVAMDLLPPLKGRLARQAMGYAGSVPRLARGEPL